LGVLEIGFNLYQLRQKVWMTTTRVCNLVLEVGTIILAGAMLNGPSLIDLSMERFAGTSLIEVADVLTKVMSFAPTIVLIVVLVVSSIEVAQTAYRLIKNRPSMPYPLVKQ
jgi:hypothetical protein